MLNQIVIVGRLTKEPEVVELESGKKVSNITLAIPRSYKNAEGDYDTDFVNCRLWDGIASNTAEYCKQGDLVGVKGRIETSSYEKDGETKYSQTVVAEKLTFLSSNKIKDSGKEQEV